MFVKRFEDLEIWQEARDGEARSQSYRAFDFKYISVEQLNDLLERTEILSRKMYNLMEHLKKAEIKGLKYK